MFRLQDMRDTKKLKVPLYILFALVIISFVFFYGWKSADHHGMERVYAKFRSESLHPMRRWVELTGGTLKGASERVAQGKLEILGPQWMQYLQRIGFSMFDRLVGSDEVAREVANEMLVLREAEKIGLEVSTQEVIDQIRLQPGMTSAVFEQIARNRFGMSGQQLIEVQRKSQEDKMMRSVKGLVAHASLFELWQEYKLGNEKIKLQVAAYPVSSFTSEVVLDDEELQTYLQENMSTYHVPAKRRYAFVKQTKQTLSEALAPTPDQLKAYWEQNQDKYVLKAARMAEELFVPLAADAPSTPAVAALDAATELAKQSADWTALTNDLTASNPGLSFYANKTPWLEEGSTVRSDAYRAMLSALTQDQISTPIVEANGVYMIRMIDQREAGVEPFEKVATRVETDWRGQQADGQFDELYNRMKEEVSRYNNMQSFAQAVSLKDELTSPVAANQAYVPEIGSLDKDYLGELQKGQISDVIRTDQMLVVLQIIDEQDEYDPTLDQVREQVEKDLRMVKAVEVAKQTAEQSQKLLESGADFATALADAPKAPFTTDEFTRTATVKGLEAPMIDFTKQTLNIAEGSTGITPYGYDPEKPIGYAIWKVVSLAPPSREDFVAERRDFEADYMQIQRLTIIREWLNDLRQQADFQLVKD